MINIKEKKKSPQAGTFLSAANNRDKAFGYPVRKKQDLRKSADEEMKN